MILSFDLSDVRTTVLSQALRIERPLKTTSSSCPGCGYPISLKTRTERCSLGINCRCGGQP